ncbi:hypothetical protein T03_3781 [Trichinella britovi]|uniref:Peptidase aspartic putative domain-containing protein n=1 Tax=Trichinella britovi TaxID=45882 RepID=A0A0V1C992_TRIBR|nr:hypothetical protein T03_3781 [Trichinella britovi]
MEFDELIDKLKTTQRQADELLATAETSSSAEITQPPATKNNNPKTNSTRPIPKLPTFDGDILQFKAFWDQFSAAVHQRGDLEDVTKFVHLRSCLDGAALPAISGVTTAPENYPAVVQLLHDQFYRVSDLLDAHILKIFTVTKEVVKGKESLLSLHDKLNGHLLELKAIRRDLDTADGTTADGVPIAKEHPIPVEGSMWQIGGRTNLSDLPRLHGRTSPVRWNQRKRSHPPLQTIGAFHTSLHPTCPVCQGEHRVTHRGWRTHHVLTSSATKKQTPLPEGLDDTNVPPGKKVPESSEETTTRVLLANTRGSARIRFQTVKAIATSANVKRLVINCLFDSDAEQTLVTEDTAKALGLVGMAESVTVKGIGGIHCTPTLARRVRFRLSPVKANDHDLDVEPTEALTHPQFCDDIQSVPVRCDNWKHLQHLRIPGEQDEKLPVHVLIGVDSHGQFLGWVVHDPVNPPSAHQYLFHCDQKEDNMECTLKKFWKHESIGIQQQEDKTTQDAVSRQFLDTLTHDGSRYSVGLLWKPGVVQLPDNYALAEHRLQSVERRLIKAPTKQREYSAVIEKYLHNGWAEEVTTQSGQPGKTWYLPHHAVYKMADGQTKCRVVFDGSAKCAGVSLNDDLETRPNLQADLDCEKKKGIHAASSSAIADQTLPMKVMKTHAELNPEESNETVKKALANMYVDDLVMSCDKEAEKELLPVLPREEVSTHAQRELRKIGVYWKRDEDILTFKPPPNLKTQSRSTMRQMLSLAAKCMTHWVGEPRDGERLIGTVKTSQSPNAGADGSITVR